MESTYHSFLDIPAEDIDGKQISKLGEILGGKKCILVINVASAWGITKINYTQLVPLYEEYGPQGFEILAFPCNQFGAQEPGCNADIKKFAQTYGATFPMFSKIEVNGPNTCEVYKFLKAGASSGDIPWNFAKFLVNGEGKVVSFHGPKVAPNEMVMEIETLLGQWVFKNWVQFLSNE